MNFKIELEQSFRKSASAETAAPMEAYMKNNFPFVGIKTTPRRALFQKIWSLHKEEVKENAREIALELYSLKEREFHYCAIEILMKELKKNYQKEGDQVQEDVENKTVNFAVKSAKVGVKTLIKAMIAYRRHMS